MATRSLVTLARRASAVSCRSFHGSALCQAGFAPPQPPYARSPRPTSPVRTGIRNPVLFLMSKQSSRNPLLSLSSLFLSLCLPCISFPKLVESTDAIWDDGVAPELALDFDVPNTSSREALMTLAGGFGLFFLLYQGLSLWTNGAKDNNPALSHATDVVVPDYSAPKKKVVA
jgi:hypothetical protein